jgi:hypothetical protein
MSELAKHLMETALEAADDTPRWSGYLWNPMHAALPMVLRELVAELGDPRLGVIADQIEALGDDS